LRLGPFSWASSPSAVGSPSGNSLDGLWTSVAGHEILPSGGHV